MKSSKRSFFFDAIEKLDSLDQGFEVEYSLSEQFFGLTFNDGFAEQSKEYRQQFSGTRLLEDALVRILKFEDDRFLEDGKLVKSPIQTRRFRYDLSEADLESFDESLELYGQLKSFLDLASNSNFFEAKSKFIRFSGIYRGLFGICKSKTGKAGTYPEYHRIG
ncbi:hypothetical protein [Algoriphagus boritolerans]|uniref:hypothetical protein n=1 Tax=Algoriphagus boritolerans TaxID=308111 RepID=UPI000AA6370E